MLKWSWGVQLAVMARNDVMIVQESSEIQIQRKKTQLDSGPAFLFSKLMQSFEGQIQSRRLLHQPLYNHASSCRLLVLCKCAYWKPRQSHGFLPLSHQSCLPKTCEVFKCLTPKLAKELVRRGTQAVLA